MAEHIIGITARDDDSIPYWAKNDAESAHAPLLGGEKIRSDEEAEALRPTRSFSSWWPLAKKIVPLFTLGILVAGSAIFSVFNQSSFTALPSKEADSGAMCNGVKVDGKCWTCLLYTSPSPRDS